MGSNETAPMIRVGALAILSYLLFLSVNNNILGLPQVVAVFVVLAPLILGVHFVPLGERHLYLSQSGNPVCIESGFSFQTPLLFPARSSWGSFNPSPSSLLILDPPNTKIHTKEGITGTVDVTVECVVLDYTPKDVLLDSGNVRNRACARVNQWISSVVAEVPADEARYGHLSNLFNSPTHVASLRKYLEPCFLGVNRVTLDHNGVVLDQKWSTQRAELNMKRQLLEERESVLRREAELQLLEQDKDKQRRTFEVEMKRQRVEAEGQDEVVKAQKELLVAQLAAQGEEAKAAAEAKRVKALMEAGLTTRQVSSLIMSQYAAEAIGRNSNAQVYSVPPGLIGWHGVEGVAPSLE